MSDLFDSPEAAPATPAGGEIVGSFARDVAGLPPLSVAEQRQRALAARYGGTVPAWRTWLDHAIETHPRGCAGVAEQIGVSRPYVSRIVNFHMTPAPQSFIDRVMAIYSQVQCPHLQKAITPAACRAYAARDYAAISQFEVDHWTACRNCACKAPPLPANLVNAEQAQGDAA